MYWVYNSRAVEFLVSKIFFKIFLNNILKFFDISTVFKGVLTNWGIQIYSLMNNSEQ